MDQLEQLDIFTQGKPNARKPYDMVERGCIWIRDNRDSFWTLLHIVEDMERNPRIENIGRDDVYVAAKLAGVRIEDKDLKVLRAHDRWSVISRYMLMLRPRLARIIHPQKGNIDVPNYADAWHRIVIPQTFFPADDWESAKKLYEIGDVSAQ